MKYFKVKTKLFSMYYEKVPPNGPIFKAQGKKGKIVAV
jgi:hypothetical protein